MLSVFSTNFGAFVAAPLLSANVRTITNFLTEWTASLDTMAYCVTHHHMMSIVASDLN